jgi:hypothetical protein
MKPALFLTPLLGLAACTPAAPDPRGVDRDETVLTVTGTGAPKPPPIRRCSLPACRASPPTRRPPAPATRKP